MTIAETIIW